VDEIAAVAMWTLARRVAAGLRLSGLRCEAVNFLLADGAAAGQEVLHSHLHVIPRWQGDGVGIKFPPHYGAAAERKGLDDIAERLGKRLSGFS
jgi:histidine triad (HIT) family protein